MTSFFEICLLYELTEIVKKEKAHQNCPQANEIIKIDKKRRSGLMS
jgi:hypothetical protein